MSETLKSQNIDINDSMKDWVKNQVEKTYRESKSGLDDLKNKITENTLEQEMTIDHVKNVLKNALTQFDNGKSMKEAYGGKTTAGPEGMGAGLVMSVQIALTKLGENPGIIDGIYGPITKAAVESFQDKESLQKDGQAGPLTIAKILKELDKSGSSITVPVEETEQVIETTPVEETEQVIETVPVEETEQVIETVPVEETEQVIETVPVEETEQVIETVPVVVGPEILDPTEQEINNILKEKRYSKKNKITKNGDNFTVTITTSDEKQNIIKAFKDKGFSIELIDKTTNSSSSIRTYESIIKKLSPEEIQISKKIDEIKNIYNFNDSTIITSITESADGKIIAKCNGYDLQFNKSDYNSPILIYQNKKYPLLIENVSYQLGNGLDGNTTTVNEKWITIKKESLPTLDVIEKYINNLYIGIDKINNVKISLSESDKIGLIFNIGNKNYTISFNSDGTLKDSNIDIAKDGTIIKYDITLVDNKIKLEDTNKDFNPRNAILKNTLQPLLDGVSFENMVNTVNSIKNKETRETIKGFIQYGNIVLAQEYIGMYKESLYDDNKATGKINEYTLKKLAQPYLLEQGEKVKKYLPSDIKNLYQDFLDGKETNENKNYAIISKNNYTLYMFNADHKLLSQHSVLLGKNKGDQVMELKEGGGSVFTTPGGIYTIDAITQKPSEYAGPGHFLQLKPRDWQYPVNDFAIGIHTYYSAGGEREKLLERTNGNKRVTNGCINTLLEGSVYDNLEVGSVINVAKE